jgi:hypothetical protein
MTVDRPKIASKVQRSLYPTILLKFFSVDKKVEAIQRKTIFPFFQQLTLPVLRLTTQLRLSMILVVARQRVKVGGKPKWFKVNISSIPSLAFNFQDAFITVFI